MELNLPKVSKNKISILSGRFRFQFSHACIDNNMLQTYTNICKNTPICLTAYFRYSHFGFILVRLGIKKELIQKSESINSKICLLIQ